MARQTLEDPYVFGFLDLAEAARERDLERALMRHVEDFLLELGVGFALCGRQVPLEVAGRTHADDLLFYHLDLRCFDVVELKAGPFEPEFAGKLEFYLSAVDDRRAAVRGGSGRRVRSAGRRGDGGRGVEEGVCLAITGEFEAARASGGAIDRRAPGSRGPMASREAAGLRVGGPGRRGPRAAGRGDCGSRAHTARPAADAYSTDGDRWFTIGASPGSRRMRTTGSVDP